jgi:hypothetical protein
MTIKFELGVEIDSRNVKVGDVIRVESRDVHYDEGVLHSKVGKVGNIIPGRGDTDVFISPSKEQLGTTNNKVFFIRHEKHPLEDAKPGDWFADFGVRYHKFNDVYWVSEEKHYHRPVSNIVSEAVVRTIWDGIEMPRLLKATDA